MSSPAKTDPFLLKTQFKKEEAFLLEEAQRIRSDSALNPADKGRTLEQLLSGFLRQYFPARLGVGRGYLVNVDGEISKETDVFIFDRNTAVFFRKDGDSKVIPVEAVLATIEIKSTLTKPLISSVAENISSITTLKKYAIIRKEDNIVVEIKKVGRRIFHAVFAFGSPMSLKTVAKHAADHKGTIDYLCILTKGNVMYVTPTPQEHESESTFIRLDPIPEKESKLGYFESEQTTGTTLYMFFSMLLGYLVDELEKEPVPIPLGEYYKVGSEDLIQFKYL